MEKYTAIKDVKVTGLLPRCFDPNKVDDMLVKGTVIIIEKELNTRMYFKIDCQKEEHNFRDGITFFMNKKEFYENFMVGKVIGFNNHQMTKKRQAELDEIIEKKKNNK